MASLIERVVEDYNFMMSEVDKKHPWCYKLRKKFACNKRYGFQILDEEGSVLEEYTILLAEEPYINSYEAGVKDVCMTKGVKVSALESFLDNKDEFIKNPIKTWLKNLKYLLDGSVTLGKK